jgi:uncharacterized protein with GYD domain
MSKCLILCKYTQEGLEGVRRDGYASRLDNAQKLAASLGTTMDCMYWISGGEYDVVAMGDYSSEAMFALIGGARQSGMFEKVEVGEILTADEADKSIGRGFAWSPPGQAPS